MKGLLDMGVKKKTQKPQRNTGWHRVASFMAGFLLSVLLVSEVIVMVSYVVPAMAVLLFQAQEISIDRTISIADFAMGDLVVLVMMWGSALMTMCILFAIAEWKIICFMCRHIKRLLLDVMRPGRSVPADDTGGKGDGET